MSIEAKVEQWNSFYKAWGRKEKLKNLGSREYEEHVAYSLLDICDGDHAQAIAVLDNGQCYGGWMSGDAKVFIEKLRDGVDVDNEDEDEDEDE